MYRVPEYIKKVDLTEVGCFADLDWLSLDNEAVSALRDKGYEDGCLVSHSIISELNLWDYVTDFGGGCVYDEDALECELIGVIKHAPHYLVMAHNCTWNKGSAYMLTDSINNAFYRRYEASIYPRAVSKGGKCLICTEASHDVPGGARTSVIALTEKEYEKLCDSCFEEVEAFARECERKVMA